MAACALKDLTLVVSGALTMRNPLSPAGGVLCLRQICPAGFLREGKDLSALHMRDDFAIDRKPGAVRGFGRVACVCANYAAMTRFTACRLALSLANFR